MAILKVTGDWQKFKGQPAPEPMKMAAEKPDKQALFNAALAEVSGEPSEAKGSATTPKKRAAKKVAEPAADAAEPAAAPEVAAPEAAAPEAAAPGEPAEPAATAEAPAADESGS
jgi:small subunit ribosomal protein S16